MTFQTRSSDIEHNRSLSRRRVIRYIKIVKNYRRLHISDRLEGKVELNHWNMGLYLMYVRNELAYLGKPALEARILKYEYRFGLH